jgi:hypothetical protein
VSNGDGSVQLQPESTGKKVDTSELTRDDATIVERQRAVLADNANVEASGVAEVRDKKLQTHDEVIEKHLECIAVSLKRIEFLLTAALGD